MAKKTLPGVYETKKKDGTIYYRSNITYKSKHIWLGGFEEPLGAYAAYREAKHIIDNPEIDITNILFNITYLNFKKAICILNLRDNKIYLKTPIYLRKGYFEYYLSRDRFLIFDIEDMFYYSTHSITVRGGHMFVADYGAQYNILERYGIRSFAVAGRDYIFANGNTNDFRYENIVIINKYIGVRRMNTIKGDIDGEYKYEARIHLKSDILIGRYDDEITAAIAYNKACDYARNNGIDKDYTLNSIEDIPAREYANIYAEVELRDGFYQKVALGT